MDPLVALALIVALVGFATAAGLFARHRSGRARRPRLRGAVDLHELGIEPWATTASVVQFSTEYCARCPAVRRALTTLVADHPDVAVREIDLTHRAPMAARFKVLQTPTVLVFDGAGAEVARFSGAVDIALVRSRLAELKEAPRVVSV